MDFWGRTSGTWINVATVLIGTVVGLLLRDRLPVRMQELMTQSVGLITLLIGFRMANSLSAIDGVALDGIILGLIGLVVGGLLGEWLKLEQRLEGFGQWLKQTVKGDSTFTEGFVAASLLFCVGPLTLVGSINNGLQGDNTLLVIKATMDGLAAIALTSSFGIGVGFSALTVLVYQGGISLLAGGLATTLPDPSTHPAVLLITGIGGLMIVAIGLNLLQLTHIRVASFLPALLLAPVLVSLVSR